MPALDLAGTRPTDAERHGLGAWPGAAEHDYLGPLVALIGAEDTRASLAGAWFLPLDGLDEASRTALAARGEVVVTTAETMREAGIGLVVVQPDGTLETRPFAWRFDPDGGPFGAADLLVIKPLPGLPLAPRTRHAVFLTSAFATDHGARAGRSEGLAQILAGEITVWTSSWTSEDPTVLPPAHDAALRNVIADLDTFGVPRESLVGLAVADTGDPAAFFLERAQAALGNFAISGGPPGFVESFDSWCVVGTTLQIPDFQHGTLPFTTSGDGVWRDGPDGRTPTLARTAESRAVLAIPNGPPPPGGWPLAVFVRTGGGGDRPLVDRGPRPIAGGPSDPPTGAGPAAELTAAGWAALSWDGPHGGLRNVTNGDEQFLMFNILNPAGARANIWQTALEAAMLRRAATTIFNDAAACPGTNDALIRLNTEESAIVGHSMGAWVAPLAMALDPAFGAAVLSGAGGGWIENAVFKQKPVAVRPLAELLLGYGDIDRALTPHDPALTLLQWAGEAADPQVFGAHAMTPPRSVLVVQGIVDRYILPPISAALQVAMGLDLAGPGLETSAPELDGMMSLAASLMLAGRSERPRPVSANRDGRTAVVVHWPEDGIEDGHEAFFQQAGARRQHRCFMQALASGGTPTIDNAADDAPCPASAP